MYSSLGKLEEPLQIKSGYGIAPFVPIKIELNKDSTKFKTSSLLIEPGINLIRYVFKNKIIPNNDGNTLSFSEDTNPNNKYNNNIFSPSSAIQFTAVSGRIFYNHKFKKLKNLQFSAGIHGQYILGGSFLRKFTSNENKVKMKYKFKEDEQYYYFNRLQYGLIAGASYKWLTLFGSYSFTTLFKQDKGPDFRMYHFGFFLNFFWKKFDSLSSRIF